MVGSLWFLIGIGNQHERRQSLEIDRLIRCLRRDTLRLNAALNIREKAYEPTRVLGKGTLVVRLRSFRRAPSAAGRQVVNPRQFLPQFAATSDTSPRRRGF